MKLERKEFTLLILAACAASLITFSVYWYFEVYSIYEVIEMSMDVYVDTIVGINVDTDAVHFGKVPPGASGSREMTVTAGNYKTRVTFEHYGSISEWTSVDTNEFLLEPNENKTVFIQISVPDNIIPLDYRNGTLRIIFRMA